MPLIDSKPDSDLIARQLKAVVRGRVLHDRASVLLYSTDASIYRIVPAVVVQPVDTDDVVRTVLLAADMHIPIAARGAGTGLAGESLTTGIVLDFTRFMTAIDDDGDASQVTAQPGVILDRINQTFAGRGYRFGPDPSSGSRATVGGTIGNNATGAHSLRYGYAGDHVRRLQVVLATGEVMELDGTTRHDLGDTIHRVLAANKRVIESNWPKLKRNRAGYNLPGAVSKTRTDLIKLITGSEGTLGIVTSATLDLVPLPKAKIVLQANFDSLDLMAQSLPMILEHDPSAVELMDRTLLTLAKEAYPQLKAILPDAAASLLIEFDADTPDEAGGRLTDCGAGLEGTFGGHVVLHRFDDAAEQAQQFEARKRAVPLLFRRDVGGQPIPIIEDVAVPPEKLQAYISGLAGIFGKHDLQATYFAHAGPGELHVRPYLDLRRAEHRIMLGDIAREAYEVAWALGGTISGEHGVGRLRGWALRKQYGGAYDLMVRVKTAFDPQNLLNPGKIVTEQTDVPVDSIRADLTAGGHAGDTALDFDGRDPFRVAQLCNGCGECRGCDANQLMCPVFRAENDEALSPRGRAGIVREYLAGNLCERDLQNYPGDVSMDLCLLCGSCVRECPSGVDVPALVVEARARRNAVRRARPAQIFFAYTDRVMDLAAKVAPVANLFANNAIVQRAMQMVFHMHPARTMPRFGSAGYLRPLRRLLERYKVEGPRHRAVWFLDLVPRYQDRRLAEAFVKVCAKNGIELVLPPQKPSGITELVYGHIGGARRIAEYNLRHLDQALRDADMILSLEPTATLSLTKEYGYLIRDDRTERVAHAAHDATAFLLELAAAGRLNTEFRRLDRRVAYHCPCHLRLLGSDSPGLRLLNGIGGVEVTALPAQCCGLSGTFGLQTDKYDLSMQIAEGLQAGIEEIGPDVTCSECGSCRMQLAHIAAVPSVHPVHILADAYG